MANKGSLKDRFNSYGVAPKPGAWDSIAGALPQKRKKVVVWWWISGGIAAAASIVLFLSVLNGDADNSKNIAIDTIEQQIKIEETGDNEALHDGKKIASGIANEVSSSEKLAESAVENEEIETNSNPGNSLKNQSSAQIADADNLVDSKEGRSDRTKASQVKKTSNESLQAGEMIAALEKDNPPKANDIQMPTIKAPSRKIEIDLMALQSTEQIQLAFNPIPPKMVEIAKQRNGKWLMGVKLMADAGIGADDAISELNNSGSTQDVTWYSQWTEGLENAITSPFPLKINRPLGLALLIRYQFSPRFFMEIDPRLQLYRIQSELPFQTASSKGAKNYYSFGGGLSLGYKIIKRRRWAIDIAAGMHHDRLRYEVAELNLATEKKNISYINSSQFTTSLGVNYQITDRAVLRLAPALSLPLRFSSNTSVNQLQRQRFGGISFSLLRNF